MIALRTSSRRASIYLLTLITVTAVTSIVLIGVSLRNGKSNQSIIVQQMNSNSSGLLDASEFALAQIKADPFWETNAQKGSVFPDFILGDRAYSSSVLDAKTLTLPNDETTVYRVQVESNRGVASQMARFDLNYERVDYLDFLNGYSLKHYWPLNEPAKSTRAIDQKDNYDGVYLDSSVPAQSTNDEGGTVPVFSRTGDHVQVPWDSDFRAAEGAFTVWIRYDGPARLGSARSFLGMNYEYLGNPTVNMAVYNSSIWVYLDERGGWDINNTANSAAGSIVSGQWHHVAMTWGSAGLHLYIDGVLQASKKNYQGVYTPDAKFGGEQPLFIGGGYDLFYSGTAPVGFDGAVAHVAMMNRQLTDTQIAEIAEVKPNLSIFDVVDVSWAVVPE